MVTLRVQGERVGQPLWGDFFGHKTPLDSVGTQVRTEECHELLRGLVAQHPFELIRTPEGALRSRFED